MFLLIKDVANKVAISMFRDVADVVATSTFQGNAYPMILAVTILDYKKAKLATLWLFLTYMSSLTYSEFLSNSNSFYIRKHF